MDENKDKDKNIKQESVPTGFDSADNITGNESKTEGTFTPNEIFKRNAKDENDGYTVTPNGGYYTAGPGKSRTEDAKPINEDADEKAKKASKTPDFIPSGTYSYSAAKGNMPDSAYNTADVSGKNPSDNFHENSGFEDNGSNINENIKPKAEKKVKKVRAKKSKETGPKYSAGVIIASAVIAAVLGAGSALGVLCLGKSSQNATVETSSETSSTQGSISKINVDETVNSSVEAVAKKAGPSIIGIRTTAAVTNFFFGSNEETEEGSGIIYSADGYIITNYHVIQSAVESANSKVEVFLPEDTKTAINATVVGYNIASDLAVVKIDKKNLTPVEFSDSDKLSIGQYVVAIGNPGGLEFIGSVSSGVISGLNRTVTVGTGNKMSLIQTDAAINPGNSGGALVDLSGKLVGVNSVKLVSTGYEGMGFAIPSNTVKKICDNIIAKQNDPTPYIGIQISESYTAAQLNALGYPSGAVVVSVVDGGPASESGIKRGDIITEFNGKTINSYSEFDSAILACKPGNSVTVKLYRSGRFYSTNVNVESNNAQ